MLCNDRSPSHLKPRNWVLLTLLVATLVFTCRVSRVHQDQPLSFANGAPATTDLADSTWQEKFLQAIYYPKEAYDYEQSDEMARVHVDLEVSREGEVTRISMHKVAMEERRPEFVTFSVIGGQEVTRDLLIRVRNEPDHFTRAVEYAIRQSGHFPIAERNGSPVTSDLRFNVVFFPQKSSSSE